MRKNKLKLVIVIISIIIASIWLINFVNRQSKIAKCLDTYLYELPLYFDKYTEDYILIHTFFSAEPHSSERSVSNTNRPNL